MVALEAYRNKYDALNFMASGGNFNILNTITDNVFLLDLEFGVFSKKCAADKNNINFLFIFHIHFLELTVFCVNFANVLNNIQSSLQCRRLIWAQARSSTEPPCLIYS